MVAEIYPLVWYSVIAKTIATITLYLLALAQHCQDSVSVIAQIGIFKLKYFPTISNKINEILLN